jgi:hypothetical protein
VTGSTIRCRGRPKYEVLHSLNSFARQPAKALMSARSGRREAAPGIIRSVEASFDAKVD